MEPFYGYRYDRENLKNLEAMAIPMPAMTFAAPDEIDPRPWHRIENQKSMGSCQGHALSSVTEFAYHIETGEVIQFSPMWCYIMTQKIDGLLGRDQGSTINGGMQCAKKYGVCRVETFPYPNPVKYSTKIPPEAALEAIKYKIRSHVMCKSYDDILQFIGAGLGGVEIGISWNKSCTPDSNGVIKSYKDGGGGHAVCFLGYKKNGNLYLANSWDENWGDDGYAEVTPDAVNQMAKGRWTVMIGLSDMTTPEPRKIDWKKDSVFH